MRTCIMDLETSHLRADFATIITGAVKEYGGPTKVFVRDNLPSSDDRRLLRAIRDELEKYDVVITYYGLKFDMPMLNSRLMRWGMKPLTRKFQIDCYPIVKRTINTTSRRLMTVSEFLGVQGKGRVVPREWVEAAYDGNKAAIANIAKHNKEDVEVLEEVYDLIKWNLHGIMRK